MTKNWVPLNALSGRKMILLALAVAVGVSIVGVGFDVAVGDATLNGTEWMKKAAKTFVAWFVGGLIAAWVMRRMTPKP